MLSNSKQFLNQSAELVDEINCTSYKQKYLNALNIISKYQSHIKELKKQIDSNEELIRNLENSQPVSDQVKSLEQQVDKLNDQKNKLKLTMDRLKLQLEQKKTQLALLQEKKAENELELKKEKKQLLESFITLRNENKNLVLMFQQQQQNL